MPFHSKREKLSHTYGNSQLRSQQTDWTILVAKLYVVCGSKAPRQRSVLTGEGTGVQTLLRCHCLICSPTHRFTKLNGLQAKCHASTFTSYFSRVNSRELGDEQHAKLRIFGRIPVGQLPIVNPAVFHRSHSFGETVQVII